MRSRAFPEDYRGARAISGGSFVGLEESQVRNHHDGGLRRGNLGISVVEAIQRGRDDGRGFPMPRCRLMVVWDTRAVKPGRCHRLFCEEVGLVVVVGVVEARGPAAGEVHAAGEVQQVPPASVGVLSVHEGFCSLKILPIGNWLARQVTRDIGGGFVAQKSLLGICP